jgi:itaconyl-CoA hydratase
MATWDEDLILGVRRVQHGLFYEDFPIGRVFKHHWGRTFAQAETIAYAAMTMQYNAIYVNRLAAIQSGYRDIPVHPLFVFTTALGLSVEDLSEAGGPFLGVDDVEYPAVVYPGDTIYAGSEVLSRRTTASRPGWGIVEWRTRAINQDGATVVTFRRRNLSKLREDLEQ